MEHAEWLSRGWLRLHQALPVPETSALRRLIYSQDVALPTEGSGKPGTPPAPHWQPRPVHLLTVNRLYQARPGVHRDTPALLRDYQSRDLIAHLRIRLYL